MLRWLTTLGPESRSLQEIHRHFLQMLQDGRHVFDAAANALLGGTDPNVVRDDLYRTDERINRMEQQIRRDIVVHGSIHGAATFPALLMMMSLVKDAERIGDFGKNIFSLAAQRPPLGTEEQRAELIEYKNRISKMIVRAHGLFVKQSEEGAKVFLQEASELEELFESKINEGLAVVGENAAGRTLACRYYKRVISHLGNIISSIVLPLDKLDAFDEPPEV